MPSLSNQAVFALFLLKVAWSGISLIGALDGRVPMSHVEFKKSPCLMFLSLRTTMSPVELKKMPMSHVTSVFTLLVVPLRPYVPCQI